MNERKPLLNNFKKSQRKAVLKLVALLLVVVTLLSTSAWSWFSGEDAQKATAEGIKICMSAQGALKMSVTDPNTVLSGDEITWHKSLDIINDTDILDHLDVVPATGKGYKLSNGKDFLYIPALKYLTNGEIGVNSDAAWTEAKPNEDYIALKVTFKTEFPANIYIGEGTSVTTWSEKNGKLLTGNNSKDIGNISKFGNFSRDAIAGALRMSVCYPEETNFKFIWYPRPDLFLHRDDASGDLVLDKSVGSSVNSWSGKHSYYDLSKLYASDTCAMSDTAFTAKDGNTNEANPLTLIGSTKDGTTCTVYIKIWIEGSDSEAVQALSRGKFQLNINFVAIATS